MTYINRPMENMIDRTEAVISTDYHDRVRWGPIFAGLVVALSTQLVLSALGAAIGSTNIAGSGAPRSNAGDVGTAVGIWSTISLLISLLVGGWMTARTCGPMNRTSALLNGAILWATTLMFSAWLLSSGVSGAFGIAASNAGELLGQAQQNAPISPATPGITAQQTRDLASGLSKVGWSFTIGSLLGLASSMLGASIGMRNSRPKVIQH
jgi:hypothetical protein